MFLEGLFDALEVLVDGGVMTGGIGVTTQFVNILKRNGDKCNNICNNQFEL